MQLLPHFKEFLMTTSIKLAISKKLQSDKKLKLMLTSLKERGSRLKREKSLILSKRQSKT